MKGTFLAGPEDPHVGLRAELLAGRRSLAQPPMPTPVAARDVEAAVATARRQLDANGYALCRLDREQDDLELRAFGELLGRPIPETAPEVMGNVDDAVILNVVTDRPPARDPRHQPFGSNPLTLHSEGSRAPASRQPRFVVLACRSPGTDRERARTVLVPMEGVTDQLGAPARAILRATAYDAAEAAPILRSVGGREVLSFRDFLHEPLAWRHNGEAPTPDAVDEALRDLLQAMYRAPALGVRWEARLLLVIDNQRHLHGKTEGVRPAGGPRRWLRRLRIGEPIR